MTSKSATKVETAIVLTTNPDLAQPFPNTGTAKAFADSASDRYQGVWEPKMLKRICIEIKPPNAPFLCPKHYYTTQAALDQAAAATADAVPVEPAAT